MHRGPLLFKSTTMKFIKNAVFTFCLMVANGQSAHADRGDCQLSARVFLSDHYFKNIQPLADQLTHNSFKLAPGTLAYDYPGMLDVITHIDQMIPSVDKILRYDPNISKFAMFKKYIKKLNKIARYLHSQAEKYSDFDPFLAENFLQMEQEVRVNAGQRNKILWRIRDEYGDRRPFRGHNQSRKINKMNNSELSGLLSKFYGERGEILASMVLRDISHRSTSPLDILDLISPKFKEVSNIYREYHGPGYIIDAIEMKEKIMEFIRLRSLRRGSSFDEHIFQSFFDKELDLVRRDGREWIEVKNLKHVVSMNSLTRSDKNIYRQAERTRDIVKMLGLEKHIDLKIIFINCITRNAARYLRRSLGVRSLGCVVKDIAQEELTPKAL